MAKSRQTKTHRPTAPSGWGDLESIIGPLRPTKDTPHHARTERKHKGLSSAPTDVDKVAVRELILYIENNSRLCPDGGAEGLGQSVHRAFLKKLRKGQFESEVVVKTMKRLALAAAKAYGKEHGTGQDGSVIFNRATRAAAARELLRRWLEDNAPNKGVTRSANSKTLRKKRAKKASVQKAPARKKPRAKRQRRSTIPPASRG